MVIMNSCSTSWVWLLWLFGEKEESLKWLPAQVWFCFFNACFFFPSILLLFCFCILYTLKHLLSEEENISLFNGCILLRSMTFPPPPLFFSNLQLNLSPFSFSYTCEIVSLLLAWMLPTFYHFLLWCYNSSIPGIILDFGLQHHCSCSLPPGLFL